MHVYQTKAKVKQAHQYVKNHQLVYTNGLQTDLNNHISRKKKNMARGPGHSIAQLHITPNNIALESRMNIKHASVMLQQSIKPLVQNSFANNTTPIQMIPQERHEYRDACNYLNSHKPVELSFSPKLAMLLTRLDSYSGLKSFPKTDDLIEEIAKGVNDKDVQNELMAVCKRIDPKNGKARGKWILQHLKNGTSDELNEYKGWRTRWSHRLMKYGAVPEATLAVQGAMQFGMGNPVSGGAFLARGALFELKLALTHGINLTSKIESPSGWQRIITSVSVLAEAAKFFETWTPTGLMPKPAKLALANASNYIKKIRAGVMGIKELPKLCFDYDLSPVDKIVNASVGEVENILNFINIGLQLNATKLNKDIIYNIVNNIAKLIRHVVDLIRLLITACKKKPTTSEMSVHLLNDSEANANAFSSQSQGLGGRRIKAQTLDQKSTSINPVQEASDASSVNSVNEHFTLKKSIQAPNRSHSASSSLRHLSEVSSSQRSQGDRATA